MTELPTLSLLLVLVGGVLARARTARDCWTSARRCKTRISSGSPPAALAVTRAFVGFLAAVPVCAGNRVAGCRRAGSGAAGRLLGFAVAPQFLASVRRRAEQALLDDLPLHLDLIALAMEAGSSLPAALALCRARAGRAAATRLGSACCSKSTPASRSTRRCASSSSGWRCDPSASLVLALRSAERAGADAAAVLRERARQAAASRFARAERMARAAPLKLWATLMLCIAPCTLVVLAFPVAQLLALLFDRAVV